MAKNQPGQASEKQAANEKKQKDKGGGLLGKLIAVVIFLAIVGLLAGVIGFNFMGLRERYLRGIIDMIPVVNELIPPPTEIDANADPRESMTNAELIAEIDSLQYQLELAENDKSDLNQRIGLYTSEIAILREIEAQQEQFRQEKAEFDEMIARNDPNAFARFYESISPENADIIYREVLGTLRHSQELAQYIDMISSMNIRSSARMLETLIVTDMELVVMILNNIASDQAGGIMNAMSAENAAAVAKQMAPEQ